MDVIELDIRGEWATSPLHEAASSNRVEIFLHLHRAGLSLDCYSDDGSYPVHCAAQGSKAILEYIIRRDPSMLEKKGPEMETPLLFAARYLRVDIVLYLLGEGANYRHRNRQSQTFLDILVCEDPDVASKFRDFDWRTTSREDIIHRLSGG